MHQESKQLIRVWLRSPEMSLNSISAFCATRELGASPTARTSTQNSDSGGSSETYHLNGMRRQGRRALAGGPAWLRMLPAGVLLNADRLLLYRTAIPVPFSSRISSFHRLAH